MPEELTIVSFTNLDKVLYPELGITKAQVIEYFIRIAPKMLELLVERSLSLTRFLRLRFDKTPFECTFEQIRSASLKEYTSKRNFSLTPEPPAALMGDEGATFVVQEHHARKLHYDFRVERQGVLKSWAVPKGLPTNSGEKRLAVEVEDHPLEYGKFEGTIPTGQYGAGTVKIWDKGSYELVFWKDDEIELVLNGKRLTGRYVLVRFERAGPKQWLLIKAKERR